MPHDQVRVSFQMGTSSQLCNGSMRFTIHLKAERKDTGKINAVTHAVPLLRRITGLVSFFLLPGDGAILASEHGLSTTSRT